MLNIFKNKYFLFWVVKINTKKERLEKPKMQNFFLLIPENIDDKNLSVCTIIKIPTEYREKGIRCFKN